MSDTGKLVAIGIGAFFGGVIVASLPKRLSSAQQEAFAKGMKSNDAAAVLKLANAFMLQGFVSEAEQLRGHALWLQTHPAAP